jgi:RNA polymerase sigma factor (sigma-70 family)
MECAGQWWAGPARAPMPARGDRLERMATPRRAGAPLRMPTTDELEGWMRAVATAADRTAFAALFRHYAPRVKGFLVRSGTSDGVAEELAQEAMAVLWRRAASFDPRRAQLSTWLFTIARNLCIDHHRRQGGATTVAYDETLFDDDRADDTPGPDERMATAQRERRVRDALGSLPPEQAEVLRLSFFDDQPHARIAEVLGIPLGTVKSRIRLAVAQLRRLLDGFES